MYRIGEFSKLSNLSVRTLRYYDEIGLLKPEYIDDFTGYRYYTDNNLSDSYLINLLKSVNFSLEEIIAYKDCLSSEVIDAKASVLQEEINDLQFKIKKLQIIKNELSMGSDVKKLTLSKDNASSKRVA